MAFEFVELDVTTPTATRVLNWISDALVIQNNTPYPLYLNWRTTKIPTQIAYDYLIPGGMWTVLSAVGNNFGFFLDTSGTSIPALGKRCNITIQADEIIPSFSQANWKSSFSDRQTITDATEYSYVINAAGAAGVLVNINVLSQVGTDGCRVTIRFSADGDTYSIYKYHHALLGGALTLVLPASTDYVQVLVRNQQTTVGNSATFDFTYSLLDFYAPLPPKEHTIWFKAQAAALAANNSLNIIPITWGERDIDELDLYFETAAAAPYNYRVLITVSTIVSTQRYMLANDPPLHAGSVEAQLGQGAKFVTHRRSNEFGFRIPLNVHTNDNIIVTITAFLYNLTNVVGVVKTRIKT